MEVFFVVMVVVLVFLSAFRRTAEATSVDLYGELCPTNCSCSAGGSELTVECPGRTDVHSGQLFRQLDTLLSGNPTYGQPTVLNIANSSLGRVPRSVCRLKTLTHLHLDRNRLARLPDNCFTNLTDLVSLTASRNYIAELQDGLFDGLHRLERLVLSDNRISVIGLRVFSGSAMLTSLRYVELYGNSVQILEPWFYYVSINGDTNHRAFIDLSQNNISTFKNMMGWKAKPGRKTIHFLLKLDRNPIRHISDAIRGWNMTLLTAWFLSPFSSGLELSLSEVHLDCDCVDFDIFKLKTIQHYIGLHLHFLNNVYCGRPAVLYHQAVTTIPLDQFVCELTERCPPGCRCVHRPANATLHVYCSNTNITVFPTELPELPKTYTKYKLDFSNNRLLRSLEYRDYFVSTSILDVSNCSLDFIDFDLWKYLANISRVFFDGNQLQSLPSFFATTSLEKTELGLSRNPWTCSCDSGWMSDWLKSVQKSITNPDNVVCSSPPRLKNRNIVGISRSDFCEDPASRAVRRALTVGMSVIGSVVLVLMSAGVVVYRLRIKLFARWKFHPFDRDTCQGEDMDYDLFLSCSSSDNLPHGNGIRHQVERHGYRVCYPPRDFLAGGTIYENIYNAVVRSKRVVCFLTAQFLQRFVLSHFSLYFASCVIPWQFVLAIWDHTELAATVPPGKGSISSPYPCRCFGRYSIYPPVEDERLSRQT